MMDLVEVESQTMSPAAPPRAIRSPEGSWPTLSIVAPATSPVVQCGDGSYPRSAGVFPPWLNQDHQLRG